MDRERPEDFAAAVPRSPDLAAMATAAGRINPGPYEPREIDYAAVITFDDAIGLADDVPDAIGLRDDVPATVAIRYGSAEDKDDAEKHLDGVWARTLHR